MGPRLGWIAAQALRVFTRHGWVYLILLGYIALAGMLWGMLLFGGALFLGIVAGLSASNPLLVLGWVNAYLTFALVSALLLAAGFNGGLLRMLAPLAFNRAPDLNAFFGGVILLGPRLLTVFVVATLLAAIPLLLLCRFLIDLIGTYGWGTISSPWNKTFQWWLLEQVGWRLGVFTATVITMQLLLGPWQVVVGTRKINLFAGLPVALSYIVRHATVSVPVIGLIWLMQWLLNGWSAEAPYLVLLVQFLLVPVWWTLLICLFAAETPEPPALQRRMSTLVSRTAPLPPEPPSGNPVPGLLPG